MLGEFCAILIGVLLAFPFLLEMCLSFFVFFWKFPKPDLKVSLSREPFVSVLVPAYREPPKVLIATLEALRNQDYSNYEVLVLINNTPEPELWVPVKNYCEKIGPPFKFIYFDYVEGYKAGVLKEAEKYLDPRTEIIGVVDSDYIVKRDFIKNAILYFSFPQVGVVQFPQDYRDFPRDLFHLAMYYCYRYFFAVIMKFCDMLGATAFMGTVGFIKKEALTKAGSWDGKVLTEDSETGLRINAKGYKCIYVDKSVGRGLMPLDFRSCKNQRYRWAYGNMQTIIKHLNLLFWGKELPVKKKLAFIAQNTVWHNPFLLTLILGYSSFIVKPLGLLSLTVAILYLFSKMVTFLFVYKKVDRLPFYKALLAYLFYLSLFVPMTLAPVKALLGKKVGFKRTPKSHVFLKSSVNFEELVFFIFVCVLVVTSLKIKATYAFLTGLILMIYPFSYFIIRSFMLIRNVKNINIDFKDKVRYENWNYLPSLEKGSA